MVAFCTTLFSTSWQPVLKKVWNTGKTSLQVSKNTPWRVLRTTHLHNILMCQIRSLPSVVFVYRLAFLWLLRICQPPLRANSIATTYFCQASVVAINITPETPEWSNVRHLSSQTLQSHSSRHVRPDPSRFKPSSLGITRNSASKRSYLPCYLDGDMQHLSWGSLALFGAGSNHTLARIKNQGAVCPVNVHIL